MRVRQQRTFMFGGPTKKRLATAVIYDYQFGFGKNYASSLALIDITDMMYNCLDKKEYVIGLYLDIFGMAFDTVNHDLLLSLLFNYGVTVHLHRDRLKYAN